MAVDYAGTNSFAFLDEDVEAAPAPAKKEKKEKPKKVEPRKSEPRKDNKPREQKQRDNSGGRGGARGGGGGRGGKRQFDRQSGTGRRDTQRREGRGQHNWGAEGDDGSTDRRAGGRDNRNRNKDAAAAPADGEAAAAPADGEAAAPAAVVAEADAEPVPEPEPEVVSYETYLARKAEAALEEDNTEARAVENDDSQWKGAAAFVKDDTVDLASEYGLGSTGKKGEGKKKGKKASGKVNIDEFMKAQQGGNRRGGRRGGKGGKGGNSSRGGRGITYDDSNFPKLG